jgi:hypothetical protein
MDYSRRHGVAGAEGRPSARKVARTNPSIALRTE